MRSHTSGGGIYSAATSLRVAAALFWSALREIFDESAYDRYLRRHGLLSSCASWAGFVREHAPHGPRHLRCC